MYFRLSDTVAVLTVCLWVCRLFKSLVCHVFLVQKLLLAVGPQNLRGSADNKLEQFLPPIYPELKARVTGIPARLAHASRRGKLMVASLSVLERVDKVLVMSGPVEVDSEKPPNNREYG